MSLHKFGSNHNCGNPGCSRRGSRAGRHCSSPGCTGGESSRYTQEPERPKDPKPMAGTKTRQENEAGFSTVCYAAFANGLALVLLRYADVEKYNGLKLALYDEKVWEEIDKTKLDPHFYPDDKGPVARFEPTNRGIVLGMRAMAAEGDMVTLANFQRIIRYNTKKGA